MSDDDLRVAEEQREALDAWRGHPWFADERDPDDEDDPNVNRRDGDSTPSAPAAADERRS